MVFSAAALKQVPSCEFFPIEAIRTNAIGADNVMKAALVCDVKKMIVLSTDKAVYPINAMGMSKALMEKLMIAKARSYSGSSTIFCGTRYGNVMGSRGSVIPFFMSIQDSNELPITDPRMTRFMITLEQSVELVWCAFEDMKGGEIYVKKIPSMQVPEIAKAVAPEATQITVGIRPGEKLHEQMIGSEDALYTYEYAKYFKILPAIHNWSQDPARINNGNLVDPSFTYCSDNNTEWMNCATLQAWIEQNRERVGKI